MASKLLRARFGVALAGAAMAMVATALPASAEATGEVDHGGSIRGPEVLLEGRGKAPTTLINLTLSDGTKLKTYCVELDVNAVDRAPMREAPWADYPDSTKDFKSKPDKVLWILNHSYPSTGLEKVGEAAGIEHLSEGEAIAGTQAAIWHFSNGAKLSEKESNTDVKKLYGYLTGDKNVGQKEEPTPSLQIEPKTGKGVAGEKIGPFTVRTTATGDVALQLKGPDGVKVVDADGNPLAKATDGTKFFVLPPEKAEAGKATVEVEAESVVHTGRLFVGKGTQTLITAQSTKQKNSDQVEVSWTTKPITPTSSATTTTPQPTTSVPAPSDSNVPGPTTTQPAPVPAAKNDNLANTGASVLGAIGIGIVLVGAGVTALVLQRRRRSKA
ncbi:TQXA domain-containing protein [Longimycelium tulufanense]|uniref:TQXA domain-containing protein n=1 Tax=Longimycelium tulufanense TaxID=907463 RepID=A0A8J3CKM9_9PSEU|nr:thioester domain-containing protein [Longimycelium tulufanense]GGM81385.1 TQXA domain-containing protein [Longimycelium tulufanense]